MKLLITLMAAALPLLPGETVPQLETASDQLVAAKQAKSATRGLKGADRIQAMEKAIAAYEAVALYFPEASAEVAEASFRVGEMHRTLGERGAAQAAFEAAFDAGEGIAFRPRALLEIGHLHRRTKEFEQAIHYYGRVVGLAESGAKYANDAHEWTGRTWMTLKDWDQALAAFSAWIAQAEGDLELVKASDWAARAEIAAGSLEAADKRILLLQQQLQEACLEPTKQAVALQKALGKLKSPALLEKARAKAASLGAEG